MLQQALAAPVGTPEPAPARATPVGARAAALGGTAAATGADLVLKSIFEAFSCHQRHHLRGRLPWATMLGVLSRAFGLQLSPTKCSRWGMHTSDRAALRACPGRPLSTPSATWALTSKPAGVGLAPWLLSGCVG